MGDTSGLFDFAADSGFVAAAFRDPLRDWTPQEIVAIATAHPPYSAPGAGWAYSDTNYFVAGLIVEAATGHALASELHRRIVGPLRLRRTRLDSGPRIAGRHAHGYFLRPLEDVTVGSPSVQWAAGALVSTVDDVARFFRALLGGRLLRADLLRAMRTTVPALLLGPGNEYGLGLQKLPLACGSAWGHTGASPGYSVDAFNRRDGTRQVVLAVNATGALGAAGFFGAPASAQPAIERLIGTAYCGVATPADSYPGGVFCRPATIVARLSAIPPGGKAAGSDRLTAL